MAHANHASAKQSTLIRLLCTDTFAASVSVGRGLHTRVKSVSPMGPAPCAPATALGPNQCKLSIAGIANEEI